MNKTSAIMKFSQLQYHTFWHFLYVNVTVNSNMYVYLAVEAKQNRKADKKRIGFG